MDQRHLQLMKFFGKEIFSLFRFVCLSLLLELHYVIIVVAAVIIIINYWEFTTISVV